VYDSIVLTWGCTVCKVGKEGKEGKERFGRKDAGEMRKGGKMPRKGAKTGPKKSNKPWKDRPRANEKLLDERIRRKGSGRRSKYLPTMPLQMYRMLKAGLQVQEVLKTWNVGRTLLYNYWRKQYPELREAMDIAEEELRQDRELPEYIYQRLRPELKALWDKIKRFDREKDGQAKIELLLMDGGKRVRQQLFLHALCMLNFNASEALSKLRMTKRELDKWIMEDQDFCNLVEEIDWHKANFFETALVQLVKEGVPAAVVHANRTYNRERGYGVVNRHEVSGTVGVDGKVLVGVLDLTELMPYMNESVKLGVLEAIRAKEEEDKKKLGKERGVFDPEETMRGRILEEVQRGERSEGGVAGGDGGREGVEPEGKAEEGS